MTEAVLNLINQGVASLPLDIRDDVRQDVVLACLEDGVTERGVHARLKEAIKRRRRSFFKAKFQELSIDQPLKRGEESGTTFAEMLPERAVKILRDPGRPKTKQSMRSMCLACKQPFEWTRWRNTVARQYCSRQCSGEAVSKRRTKITLTHKQLRSLYWDRSLSLKSIATLCGVRFTSVHHLMKEYGIDRRPTGQNHPPAESCVIAGCAEPIHRHLRKKDGTLWGNRCLRHLREYNCEKTKRHELKKRNRTANQKYWDWKQKATA